MDRKEVQEGEYDCEGIGRSDYWNNQFDVYRKCFKKLEEDIISNRNCLSYLLSITISELDYLSTLVLVNSQKMKLINEVSNKLDLLNDRKNVLFDNYLALIKNYNDYIGNLKSDK